MLNTLGVKNGYPGEEIPMVLAILLVLLILLWCIGIIITKRAAKQFSSMNYARVLRLKKALLYYHKRSKELWRIYLMLAVSSYEMGHESDFIEYINMMSGQEAQSAILYWKCVHMFFKGQDDIFESYFAELKRVVEQNCNDVSSQYLRSMEVLVKKRNGEYLTEEDRQQIEKSVSKTIKEYINQ